MSEGRLLEIWIAPEAGAEMISWLLVTLIWIRIVNKLCGALWSDGGDSDCIELYSSNFSVVLVFIHLRHGHVVHVLKIFHSLDLDDIVIVILIQV